VINNVVGKQTYSNHVQTALACTRHEVLLLSLSDFRRSSYTLLNLHMIYKAGSKQSMELRCMKQKMISEALLASQTIKLGSRTLDDRVEIYVET
jgi:hypothetical protein